MVHPVPEPAAQAGFSSVPLLAPGLKDGTQAPSFAPLLSYTDSEKTEQVSSVCADSSATDEKISGTICWDAKSLKIAAKCSGQRINGDSRSKREDEQEKEHGRKLEGSLAVDDHVKVTFTFDCLMILKLSFKRHRTVVTGFLYTHIQ